MSALVCILTAGKGSRMGAQGEMLNKALLPLRGRAIISHIIERFPHGTRFVIALGYRGEQVRSYLSLAHPDVSFKYVQVPRFEGPGTGPGLSLATCESELREPFYFAAADTLFSIDPTTIPIERSWIGVSQVPLSEADRYCNVECGANVGIFWNVENILDKQTPSGEKPWFAFSGLGYFKDWKSFFESLGSKNAAAENEVCGELQVSSGIDSLVRKKSLFALPIEWTDVGTEDRYRNAVLAESDFDFGKTGECVYVRRPTVIKFFADSTVSDRRVMKVRHNPGVFPEMQGASGGFYSYRFTEGATLYEETNPQVFKLLTEWLEVELWKRPNEVDMTRFRGMCRTFYREKTLARVAEYKRTRPESLAIKVVDGIEVSDIDVLMNLVPWEQLESGVPVFIHGDLQPDNILFDRSRNKFVLLDWRQDFAGETSFGDIHYDFAKLYGGLLLNYREVREGRFQYLEDSETSCRLIFPSHPSIQENEAHLRSAMRRNGISADRIHLMVGLIFVNMAPLHNGPFDKLLFALGRKLLTEVLRGSR